MSNIYLLYGNDEYLLKKEAVKLISENNIDEFNVSRYELSEANGDEVMAELQTVSLLGDTKLVILTNPLFLCNKYNNEAFISDMKYFIESDNPDTILVMLAEFKPEGDIYNLLKDNHANIKEIKDLTGDNLKEYIKSYVSKEGYSIDDDALTNLLERTKEDTVLVFNEIDKLMLGADNYKIDYKLVSEMVAKDIDDNIYDLLNAFIARDNEKLMSIYRDFMFVNADEIRIMNAISGKIEEIYYTKVLMHQGLGKDDIAGYFKVKPGRAYYMIENAKRINDSDIKKLIKRINKLDLDIKSGNIDKKQGLELFLLGA